MMCPGRTILVFHFNKTLLRYSHFTYLCGFGICIQPLALGFLRRRRTFLSGMALWRKEDWFLAARAGYI